VEKPSMTSRPGASTRGCRRTQAAQYIDTRLTGSTTRPETSVLVSMPISSQARVLFSLPPCGSAEDRGTEPPRAGPCGAEPLPTAWEDRAGGEPAPRDQRVRP
jgi:hypothetical protein